MEHKKTLEDYLMKMSFFPTYKRPAMLTSDKEFCYYEFAVPKIWVNQRLKEKMETEIPMDDGTLEPPAVLKMDWYPVHVGIEELNRDTDFVYYKCPVPKLFISSEYGILYRLTQVDKNERFEVDDDSFKERAKDINENDVVEVTFECPYCSEIVQEVTTDLFTALFSRSCGSCGSKHLKVLNCKTIQKMGDKDTDD